MITRTVWVLSAISLFTDIASEMLYPVLPIYLQSIGFSMLFIGVLEGVAEAVAGLSKGYFGQWSDSLGKRKPFVQFGYAVSALAKPAIILFPNVFWVLGMRTLDRLGKGIRTGARDALLSAEVDASNKASIFGFHRGMDSAGATIGPLVALIFLWLYPQQYTALFLLAFIPGLAAILLCTRIKENTLPPALGQKPGFLEFVQYWKQAPDGYKKLTGALIAFSLTNSSDVFLLLALKQQGLNDHQVIGVYIFYNLIYALASFPMGRLADKLGCKTSLIFGLSLFAIVYFGVASAPSLPFYAVLFFLYGLYAAATEGISKAWITNLVDARHTATAIGLYTAFSSIGLMFASALAGLLWTGLGSSAPFWLGGIGAICTLTYLSVCPISKAAEQA